MKKTDQATSESSNRDSRQSDRADSRNERQNLKQAITKALLAAASEPGQYLSGERMSEWFGVTRAAVSKAIQSLQADGMAIEATKHHGYRLSGKPDRISEPFLHHALEQAGVSWLGLTVRFWDQIDSTNLAARRGIEDSDPDGTVYCAESQTAGRGRRGKTWLSPAGEGLWFSLLLRPEVAPERLSRITLFIGLCAAEALRRSSGLDIRLKWPNDLVVLPSGRKLGGILTEMLLEEGHTAAVIVGIGLNCHTRVFPSEVAALATSLDLEAEQQGREPLSMTRSELLSQMLLAIESRWQEFVGNLDLETPGSQPDWLDDFRAICATLGRPVRVVDSLGHSREGLAVGLAAGGDLLVRWPDGSVEAVSAGEVSVRGLLGWL